MTRQVWERTITDAAGNVQTGVQVTVFQSDGATIATIYGQQSGGAAQANPFNTGSQTTAKFYADPGRYVIRVVKDGQTKEFWDQDIAGKAVRDDLGSAAYLVASAGVGDTTIGRAARIGDHGLGLDSNDLTRVTAVLDYSGGVDFNTVTAPGWHKVLVNASNSSNYPPFGNNSGYWYLHVLKYGSTQLQQYAYTYMIGNTDPHVVWVRARYNGTWTTWQQATAAILGGVSFDATIGRTSGAIIERGSNSNGEYVKFADGTMICTSQLLNANVAPSGGPVYFSGSMGPIPSPAAFADLPIAGFASSTSENIWFGVLPNVSGSYVRAFSTTAGAAANYRITLVGRWR